MSDTAQCHNLEPRISLDLILILPDPANIQDLYSHTSMDHNRTSCRCSSSCVRSAVVCCCMNGRGGCG